MNLILLGAPGVGKGTQGLLLAEKLAIPVISTGQILREAVANKTELGKQAEEIMNQGKLLPDELMLDLIKQTISKPNCAKGFILDGFPRTELQAAGLEQITTIDAVIEIQVPKQKIIARLSGRRVHPESGRSYHILFNPPKNEGFDDVTGEALIQRKDDQEAVINHRLQVYEQQTAPLIKWYQNAATQSDLRYIGINGEGNMSKITAIILQALQSN